MSSSGPVSGMAASIRSATESMVFDLAGSNVDTIRVTIERAFELPFELSEMIRITFVTGAGKLARQRYDPAAAKVVMSALRSQGYEDDKGASCVMECGGLFKQQHDTGKNLYTVVVFPKVKEITSNVHLNNEDSSPKESMLEEGSPTQMIAMSSIDVFTQMITSRCKSWSQKKNCLKELGDVKDILSDLDAKLLSGVPLNDSEQDFYDEISMDMLTQKENLVRSKMQKHVEEGDITALERKRLAEQVSGKIETLEKEIQVANEEKKPKKADKLSMQRDKLVERESMLKKIAPKAPHPLRFESEIQKLRKEMQPLVKLEKDSKGRLLTLKETSLLSRKEEILDEISDLENKSRGWFEDDDHFQNRLDASRSAARKLGTNKSSKKPTGSKVGAPSTKGGKSASQTKWLVPGPTRSSTGRNASSSKGRAAKSATNAFAAMMMDSDSDSD